MTTSARPDPPRRRPASLEAELAAQREDAPWFRALAPAEQAVFRRRWDEDARRGGERAEGTRRSHLQCALRGLVVFALTDALFGTAGWIGLGIAVVAGAVLGFLWGVGNAGPMRAALTGGPAYATLVITRFEGPGTYFYGALGLLCVSSLCYGAMLDREWKRSDGVES